MALRLSKCAMASRFGVEEASYLSLERGDKDPGLRALPPLLAALDERQELPVAGDPLGRRLRAWRLARGLKRHKSILYNMLGALCREDMTNSAGWPRIPIDTGASVF